MKEQQIKVLVLGTPESGVSTFINAVNEPIYVSDMSLQYDTTPKPIELYFGRFQVGKSYVALLFGFNIWTFPFTLHDMKPFLQSVNSYIVIVNSCNPGSLADVQPILKKIRSRREIPRTVIANKYTHTDATEFSKLLGLLHLEVDEAVIPCEVIDKTDAKAALLSTSVKLPDEEFVLTIQQYSERLR